MSSSAAPIVPEDHSRFYKLATLIILALYLINCFTPLRLEYDSIRYFAIRDCMDMGCPVNSPAAKDFLPRGYPFLLLSLSKIGLLRSFFIAFINAIYVCFALYFIQKIMFPANRRLLFYVLVLMHWTMIKFFSYPLSEMQYLFFASGSLYSFYRYTQNRRAAYLGLSLLLIVPAILTRTAGIALVAALAGGFAWEHRKRFLNAYGRGRLIITLAMLILVSALVLASQHSFRHYLGAALHDGIGNSDFPRILQEHGKEWGQLILNMPIGKPADYFSPTGVNGIFLGSGILFFFLFVYSLILGRHRIPAVILIYLAVYSIIILCWPFHDPRFWIPILPFIAAVIIQGPLSEIQWVRKMSPYFISIYFLIGTVAMSYSLYTEFNKKALARNQAKGIFRNEYEIHFFGKPISDTAKQVNPAVLGILEKYD